MAKPILKGRFLFRVQIIKPICSHRLATYFQVLQCFFFLGGVHVYNHQLAWFGYLHLFGCVSIPFLWLNVWICLKQNINIQPWPWIGKYTIRPMDPIGQIIATSNDLTPKWWFSLGNPLISGKSGLVKYYTHAWGCARSGPHAEEGWRWNIIIWPDPMNW